ncbi:NUDIX domain-containing protein [Candidatus Woesearchaeota archaeon]|nr:NUDIX domain-containing protein [Candidatus Woesearchaeota archaeon]MBT6519168.1 NUDIX domain-containing protein [Candidatus Woesearchaeota archaeon]MBT7367280.1 NUDIX domain-containing protein [Candidatus Woesearchaeota archaeon]
MVQTNNKIGKSRNLENYVAEEIIEAAQVILYRYNNQIDRYEVLLTKRPDYFRNFGGEYVFPGGKREPEHTNLEETGVVEVREEIGVIVDQEILEYATQFDAKLKRDDGTRVCRVSVYYAPMPEFQTAKLSDEVDDLLWLQPRVAITLHNFGRLKISKKTLDVLYTLQYVGCGNIFEKNWDMQLLRENELSMKLNYEQWRYERNENR